MEALRSIPKVLERVEDLHRNNNPQMLLMEYKKNVKLFIKNIEVEVQQIIIKYEKKIADLVEQNNKLKRTPKNIDQLPLKSNKKYSPPKETSSKFVYSGKKNLNFDLMQTAKSNLFTPFKDNFEEEIKFSSILNKYKKGQDDDNNFPVELINPEPGEDEQFDHGKSRFEVNSKRKKQREEQLIFFLQTGKKNLNHTTARFMESVGKKQKQQQEIQINLQQNKDNSNSSISIKKGDSGLNQSLGNICNSLDNSFVSKRARSQNKKRSSQIEDEARKKQKEHQNLAKMLKDKGIKNLLLRMRENVESSPTKAPEMIRTSKLINCGTGAKSSKAVKQYPQQTSPTKSRKNSKVMINPVPVDIARKNKATKRNNSPQPMLTSPKKPQSILKQTSNILSRSISGISDIVFVD